MIVWGITSACFSLVNTPLEFGIVGFLLGTVEAGFCVAAGFSRYTLVSVAAAAGVAIINSIGNLAGFASPVMIGHLRDLTHNSQSGMYALAGIMVAAAFAAWSIPAKLVNHQAP
jgi:nitrate/nitrite transporter NarK